MSHAFVLSVLVLKWNKLARRKNFSERHQLIFIMHTQTSRFFPLSIVQLHLYCEILFEWLSGVCRGGFGEILTTSFIFKKKSKLFFCQKKTYAYTLVLNASLNSGLIIVALYSKSIFEYLHIYLFMRLLTFPLLGHNIEFL